MLGFRKVIGEAPLPRADSCAKKKNRYNMDKISRSIFMKYMLKSENETLNIVSVCRPCYTGIRWKYNHFTSTTSSWKEPRYEKERRCVTPHWYVFSLLNKSTKLLADLNNRPLGSSCVTHILQFCGYFQGQEQFDFYPTSWHLVTYNFL